MAIIFAVALKDVRLVLADLPLFDAFVPRQPFQFPFQICSKAMPDWHQFHTVIEVHLILWDGLLAVLTRVASRTDAIPRLATLIVVDVVYL